MLTRLIRWFLVGYAVFIAFQNRYRIMNWALGNEKLRKWAVSASMRIPIVRNLFIQSAFSSTSAE